MAEFMPPSSPLSSAPSTHIQPPMTSSQQMNQWKSTRKLPFELQQHVRIYFEESLFTRALDFLLAVVSADASSTRNQVTLPHSEHLALTATLVVHPLITTRTTLEEKWNQANTALRLLRLLLKSVGPVNASFRDAFRFKKLSTTHDDEESEDSIKHPFANEDSIWNRAEDFWTIVGWAFNCSCLSDMYATRWNYWSSWLDFMVDVLEADWRYHVSNQSPAESMLWHYVTHIPSESANSRRIARAIFANGSPNSLKEFHEVFKRELKGPKQESTSVKKREAVDIDNEIFGDYLHPDDSDDDSETEATTSTTLRTSTRAATARHLVPRASLTALNSDFEEDATASTPSTLGSPNAIVLRLRLMQLLVNISSQPDLIRSRSIPFADLTDIFTLFVEFIKPQPLPVFSQFVSPPPITSTNMNTNTSTSKTLTQETHTTLLEFTLQRLLETTSTTQSPLTPLTQSNLETKYLPFAASKNDIESNARVSLCVESMLRQLMNAGSLTLTPQLNNAVHAGIERRFQRVKERREKSREKGREREDLAWAYLNESAARMRSVLKRLERAAG